MSVILYRRPTVAVVECPPACHTVFINGLDRKTYHLSFPWMVFVLFHGEYDDHAETHLCRPHVGFRNSPLTATDQVLCYPHLYNIYPNLKVCMAATIAKRDRVLAKTIENFWGSSFDLSLGLHLAYRNVEAYSTDPRVVEYSDWQRNTRKDPGFITNVRWKPCMELFKVVQFDSRS